MLRSIRWEPKTAREHWRSGLCFGVPSKALSDTPTLNDLVVGLVLKVS